MEIVSNESGNIIDFAKPLVNHVESPALALELLKEHNPLDDFFVLLNDQSETLGRLFIHQCPQDMNTAHIGFFDFYADDQNLFNKVMEKVLLWCQSRGITKIRGPINQTIWYGHRFRVDIQGEDFNWAPQNPLFYPKLFEVFGFKESDSYKSYFWDNFEGVYQQTISMYQKIISQGFSIRPLLKERSLLEESKLLHKQSYEIYAQSSLVHKLSWENYHRHYFSNASKYNLEYTHYLINPEGKEIGHIFAFQDYKDPKRLIVKTLSILPQYQGKYLGTALFHYVLHQAKSNGLTRIVGGMLHQDSKIHYFFAKNDPMVNFHKYKLYQYKVDSL